jgi:hypothetical protein
VSDFAPCHLRTTSTSIAISSQSMDACSLRMPGSSVRLRSASCLLAHPARRDAGHRDRSDHRRHHLPDGHQAAAVGINEALPTPALPLRKNPVH